MATLLVRIMQLPHRSILPDWIVKLVGNGRFPVHELVQVLGLIEQISEHWEWHGYN
jgi:hypothetical protein